MRKPLSPSSIPVWRRYTSGSLSRTSTSWLRPKIIRFLEQHALNPAFRKTTVPGMPKAGSPASEAEPLFSSGRSAFVLSPQTPQFIN